MTNGDHIRQMSDEELAALIAEKDDFCNMCAYYLNPKCYMFATCSQGFYAWLKQDVVEDVNEND